MIQATSAATVITWVTVMAKTVGRGLGKRFLVVVDIQSLEARTRVQITACSGQRMYERDTFLSCMGTHLPCVCLGDDVDR